MEFNLADLEKEEKKAALNLKSGKMDYKDAVNKSDKAVKKQKDAKGNVASLEQKVKEQKDYVAALKSQLAAVNRQSQIDAQEVARAQAAQAAAEAQRQAEAARAAQEEKKTGRFKENILQHLLHIKMRRFRITRESWEF